MKNLISFFAFSLYAASIQAQTYGSQYNEFYNTERFSYNYLELSYFDGEIDSDAGDVDTDGLALAVSHRLSGKNNEFFVFGSYSDLEIDAGSDPDFTVLELGGGYIDDSNEDYDLFATVAYLRTEFDGNGFKNKETGFGLSGGIRKMYDENIELRGVLNYQDVEDSGFFLDLEGDYFFSDRIATIG